MGDKNRGSDPRAPPQSSVMQPQCTDSDPARAHLSLRVLAWPPVLTPHPPSPSLPGKEERALSPGNLQVETEHLKCSQGQGGSMPGPPLGPPIFPDVLRDTFLGRVV